MTQMKWNKTWWKIVEVHGLKLQLYFPTEYDHKLFGILSLNILMMTREHFSNEKAHPQQFKSILGQLRRPQSFNLMNKMLLSEFVQMSL